MPYLCLNCGCLDVVERRERCIYLSDDGDETRGGTIETMKCDECNSGAMIVEFKVISADKKEVANRLLRKNRRRSILIEFAKLLLEEKIEIKDGVFSSTTYIDILVDELKTLGEEGKKVAFLLKVAYRD